MSSKTETFLTFDLPHNIASHKLLIIIKILRLIILIYIFLNRKNILFHIYKHNHNKCPLLDFILYINAIIINVFFLIIIIIINFHIQTKNKREKKSYYIKLFHALHGLPISYAIVPECTPFSHRVVSPIINLISETHHSYKRKKYTFIYGKNTFFVLIF